MGVELNISLNRQALEQSGPHFAQSWPEALRCAVGFCLEGVRVKQKLASALESEKERHSKHPPLVPYRSELPFFLKDLGQRLAHSIASQVAEQTLVYTLDH